MPRPASVRPAAAAALALAVALSLAAGARAADVYDFRYVDAFQPDYDLRESYLFDLDNHGRGCGFATDLPSYSGFAWSDALGKSRVTIAYPRAINDLGQVAGGDRVLDLATGAVRAIAPVPGAVRAPSALDINDRGVVVGYAETCFCSNSDHILQIPFVWDEVQGSRSIDVAGAKELVRINASNLAAGNTRGGSPDAFTYDVATGRTVRLGATFEPDPYPWTEAIDVNASGVVTGRHRAPDAQSWLGYVWTEANGPTLLPTLVAGLSVYPWALNDPGAVVGMAEVSAHEWHAFVWDATGGMQDLNTLVTPPAGFVLDRALAINERGWIAGDGHFGPGWSSSQAFVLVPRDGSPLAVPDGAARGDVTVRPNPTRDATQLEFATERAGAVSIEVFDLVGRRVWTQSATLAAGRHAVRWDGHDATGGHVPAGTYLVRLRTPDGAATRRLAVVR